MNVLKSHKMSVVGRGLHKVGLSPISLVAFVALAIMPVASESEYFLRVLLTCMFYGTLAMGFDLSAGFIGVANWGYAALLGLGGYTSAILMQNWGISPWIGMFAGAIATTLMGLFIGLLTLRMDGMFAALLAWFVGLILMNAASALVSVTNGVMGMQVLPIFDTPWAMPYFYLLLAICLIVFVGLKLVVRSNFGLAFRALGQDMQAARTTGVNPLKYRIINFCISCFIAGFLGAFYAHFIGVWSPAVLSTKTTVQVLVIAYLGGRGSIWGPLLASFIIMPIFESMNSLMEWKYIIYGVVLVLVMIFMPDGIAGLIRSAKEKILELYEKKMVKKQSST